MSTQPENVKMPTSTLDNQRHDAVEHCGEHALRQAEKAINFGLRYSLPPTSMKRAFKCGGL